MKLELKHLAAYLPYAVGFYPSKQSDLFYDLYAEHTPYSSWKYDLALEAKDDLALKIQKSYLTQKEPYFSFEDGELFLGNFDSSLGFDVDDVYSSEVLLILRPLSDLTKEITHNGETFVPINELKHLYGFDYMWSYIKNNNGRFNSNAVCMACIYKLHEWHFDTFGLIEKGLAININDLK